MSTESTHGLSDVAVERINTVLKQNPRIERAILYGSRALGTYRRGSDIDLTLEGIDLTQQDLLSISAVIDDLLLPYQVDLSLLAEIENMELVDHIDRVGRTFYSRAKD